MIEKAALSGEMDKANWAYLIDRIRMRKGLPQMYGSQIIKDTSTNQWIFHTVEDRKNINQRRKSVGLGPIEEYAKIVGVVWEDKEQQ